MAEKTAETARIKDDRHGLVATLRGFSACTASPPTRLATYGRALRDRCHRQAEVKS